VNRLDEWLVAAADELGVEHPVDSRLLLDMTRDVAHGVERPAAPLTAYLLGLAVARGAKPAEACARLSALAATWTAATATSASASAPASAAATSGPATAAPATSAPASAVATSGPASAPATSGPASAAPATSGPATRAPAAPPPAGP